MTYRMRCSRYRGCGQRFALKHPSEYYKHVLKCPHCRGIHLCDIEDERRREMAKRKAKGAICKCNGYPFPHEKGSLRVCAHHNLCGEPLTEEEEFAYLDILSTPRGSFM